MPPSQSPEVWYITGSQHLYGPQALDQVTANSRHIVAELNASGLLPYPIVFKPILTRPEEVRALCLEANASPQCAGLILWMHTFSPAKMWIAGLTALARPFLHLHTQFNRDLPWEGIDMDFMNLNQAAHGDREAGYLHTRGCASRAKWSPGIGPIPETQCADIAAWMGVGPRLARLAGRQVRALRRQHALRRRHGRRQSGGGGPLRLRRERLRGRGSRRSAIERRLADADVDRPLRRSTSPSL